MYGLLYIGTTSYIKCNICKNAIFSHTIYIFTKKNYNFKRSQAIRKFIFVLNVRTTGRFYNNKKIMTTEKESESEKNDKSEKTIEITIEIKDY
jgi:hypothetical protein